MDDVKDLIRNLLKDIIGNDDIKIKRKISRPNLKANINIERNDGSYYLSRLRILNDQKNMPKKLGSYILDLYIILAKEIENDLSGNISKTYIYNNIYLLAKEYLLSHFDPSHDDQIKSHYKKLSKSIYKLDIEKISSIANNFIRDLGPADTEIREFYSLTPNGKNCLSWDRDGSLRGKYDFDKNQDQAINQISDRKNVLWDNEKLRDLTMDLFLKSLKACFDDKNLDTSMLTDYKAPYTLSKNLLDSLLIISEAKIRGEFNFLVDINIDKSRQVLMDNGASKILDFFEDFRGSSQSMVDPILKEEIYMDYFYENPSKTSDFVNFLQKYDIESQEEILNRFRSSEYFIEILNKLSKVDFKPSRVLALYKLYRNNLDNENNKRDLFRIIREENFDIFIDYINKEEFSISLLEKILDLANPQAKKINLDKNKIEKSRQELDQTVKTISNFVGEDEKQNISEVFAEDISTEKTMVDILGPASDKIEKNNENKLSDLEKKILKKILDDGSMTEEEFKKIAMDQSMFANVFLDQINEILYEYSDDQTIFLDDGKVYIDPFYIDIVKELINEWYKP